jgi:hypothetical protein
LRLDLDSLTRADTGNRIKYYEAGLSQGWLTKDEVRLAEGMPPLPPEEAEPVPAPPEAEPPVSIVPPPKPEPPPEEGAA